MARSAPTVCEERVRSDHQQRRQRPLPGDSIRDKVIMAVTGSFLAFYVVLHLFGNLKIFVGDGSVSPG